VKKSRLVVEKAVEEVVEKAVEEVVEKAVEEVVEKVAEKEVEKVAEKEVEKEVADKTLKGKFDVDGHRFPMVRTESNIYRNPSGRRHLKGTDKGHVTRNVVMVAIGLPMKETVAAMVRHMKTDRPRKRAMAMVPTRRVLRHGNYRGLPWFSSRIHLEAPRRCFSFGRFI
jgi:hypothetical protein